MKTLTLFLSVFTLCVIVGVLPVMADIGEAQPIQVNIIDYQSLDYHDPAQKKLMEIYIDMEAVKDFSVWSRDGNTIAFNSENYDFWMVPSTGGDPTVAVDTYWDYEYEGYDVNIGRLRTVGFSADGQEFLYQRGTVDVNRGSTITITPGYFDGESIHDTSISIGKIIPVIMAVNLTTGISRVVLDNALDGNISRDGRYMACRMGRVQDPEDGQWKVTSELLVYDFLTGEVRNLGVKPVMDPCITADNSAIVYSRWSNASLTGTDLFMIPFEGGAETQITTDGGQYPECSPDGKYVVYVSGDYNKLRFYNLSNGEITDAFVSTLNLRYPKISYDGTKMCFIGDLPVWNEGNNIAIYVCDFNYALKGTAATSVETVEPTGFALVGNYPNPFNPSTTIEYTLPTTGLVDLVIYNMAGQKVRDLISGTLAPGVHNVVWDGRDNSGVPVSSGMYFTRLRMGDNVATRSLTLVK